MPIKYIVFYGCMEIGFRSIQALTDYIKQLPIGVEITITVVG